MLMLKVTGSSIDWCASPFGSDLGLWFNQSQYVEHQSFIPLFFFFCRLHAYACMYVLQATYAKITSVFVAHSGAGAKKLRHT